MKPLLPLALVALAAAPLVLVPAPSARACGGFFCAQVPVEQTGEQIIFGIDDGQITAQILINYAGEAEDFAWLLPVASTPEITLGSALAFQNLAARTQPTFRVEWPDGQCNLRDASQGFFDIAVSEPTGAGGDVSVIARKEVGPFDTVVLASSSTDDLIAWLDGNGYVQPPEARPLIDHYVRQDMVFVALRLLKDEPTGAIQPITLTFAEANPCVPLVLTQVAATPDMPVQLYLVADHRVVPTNWMHVVVNPRKIDWLNGGSNYPDLVTQAVDEAAGHGFVTEFAGSSGLLDNLVYREGQYDLAALAAATDPERFVMQLQQQGFPRDGQMLALLREHIPMPPELVAQGLSEQQFYNNLGYYADALDAVGFVFDPAAFIADLEERIITPLRDTQALFDAKPYLTRLFTTVSADEMTRDPVFSQNPDLADVSNIHVAWATATCSSDPSEPPESVLLELAGGDSLTVSGPFQGYRPFIDYPDPAPGEPVALRIELIGATGPATVLHPAFVAAVDQALDTQAPEQVLADLASGLLAPSPNTLSAGGGGCNQGGLSGLLGGLVGALSALAVLLRTRQPRHHRDRQHHERHHQQAID